MRWRRSTVPEGLVILRVEKTIFGATVIGREARIRESIFQSLEKRIESYSDLVASIDPADLVMKLDVPKDKSVAEHLWCIVGARESYARALESNGWQGFSCSLGAYDRESFERALASSGEALRTAIRAVSSWSPQQYEWLLAVSEHEVMHEGQIIRHMYGMGRDLSGSWRWARSAPEQ